MDYSKLVKDSEAADLAYARWYAKQSNEKKETMIRSGYKLVTNNVQQQAKKENPFSSKSDIIMKFIEYTQKEDYSEEKFAFIQKKMSERSEKEWQQRFKIMKKDLGWSYDEMASYMGASSGASVKASINRQLPAFAKLAVCIYEAMKPNISDK